VVQSQPRELQIYETEQGDAPFSSWLDSLRSREARAKVRKRLDRVALGNLGDYKSVGEGVFELRIDYGPGYRVYFTQVGALIVGSSEFSMLVLLDLMSFQSFQPCHITPKCFL